MATATLVPASLSPPLEVTEHEAPVAIGPAQQVTAESDARGEHSLYWGDRLGLKIWLGCVGLIVVVRVIDLIMGLLK